MSLGALWPLSAWLSERAESSNPSSLTDEILKRKSFVEQLGEAREQVQQGYARESPALAATLSRKVFIVHGHDGEPKQAVARFLGSLDFEAVILHEQPNGGRTMIEKFEKNADVGFAVVLLTPDDEGRAKSDQEPAPWARQDVGLQPRASQNVVFELGYFIGRLGCSNVCALKLGNVEVPSDISGVVYVPYDPAGAWNTALGQELEEAGYEIDWNKAMRR